MVAIKRQITSKTNYYWGTNPCNYITIHETANTSKGADAQAHANLQSRGNARVASWQWQVDDSIAIQSYEDYRKCWHAGDGSGRGNTQSIGIEICENSDGDYKASVRNAAELTAILMKKHGIPLANVVQHNNWSGKNCPNDLRGDNKGYSWSEFISLVQAAYAGGSTLKLGDRPYLKPGMSGSDIVRLQTELNDADKVFKFTSAKALEPDGEYGPLTTAFVTAFQKFVNDLPGLSCDVDGMAGVETQGYLVGANRAKVNAAHDPQPTPVPTPGPLPEPPTFEPEPQPEPTPDEPEEEPIEYPEFDEKELMEKVDMKVLKDIIPAKYRQAVLYVPYAAVGLVLGSIGVYAGVTPDFDVPSWYLGAMAVYGFVGTGVGLTASANTNTEDSQ